MAESEWWQDAAGHWHDTPRPVDVPGAGPTQPGAVGRPCPVCGREWGVGLACQGCGQVGGVAEGITAASSGRRLAGYLIDSALAIVTLLVGWLIWWAIVLGRGQTPGKQLVGIRVVRIQTGSRATWGTMFLREFVGKWMVALAAAFTCGLGFVLYFWLLWDRDRQQLWDKVVETIVVNDRRGLV